MSLKTLRLQPSFQLERQKLQREAEILASLRHDHIVAFNDVVEGPDHLYLVLELVTGGELFDRIVLKGTFREMEARHVFRQVASAIEYIHAQGVIHRDLKPENILVRSVTSGADGDVFSVALADFGVSKMLKSGLSVARTYVGTPQYWAPEVRACGPMSESGYDHRVDIWSLGVVLYVMLAGEYPFREHGSQGGGPEPPKPLKTSNAVKHLLAQLLSPDPRARMELADCLKHPWVGQDTWPADYDAWSDWVPRNKMPEPEPIKEEEPSEPIRVALPLDVEPKMQDKLRQEVCAAFPGCVFQGGEVLFMQGLGEASRDQLRDIWWNLLKCRPYLNPRRRMKLQVNARLEHGLQLTARAGEGMHVDVDPSDPEIYGVSLQAGDAIVEIGGDALDLEDADEIQRKFNAKMGQNVLQCRVATRL